MDPNKLPKTLQKFAAKISHFDDETHGTDPNGYWVYLADGWQDGTNPTCHTMHEDTVTALAAKLRYVLPCDCTDCTRGAKR